MAVGRHTKEGTFLQNDMVDLILSAGPSDPCFEESDDHPTEDRTTSLEMKTTFNSSPELNQEPGLGSTPIDTGELRPLTGGLVDTPDVLGELFPDLDQEQAAAEEDATCDVVNKTVRMEDDPQTREEGLPRETKGDERRYPEAPNISTRPHFSWFKSKRDMICYNCGDRGHICRTCPTKSNLCAELNLSPPRLYHLGQDGYFGVDIQ